MQGMFTSLIDKDKSFTYCIDETSYTEDLTKEGEKVRVDNKTRKWQACDCGKHLKFVVEYTKSEISHCKICKQAQSIKELEDGCFTVIDRLDYNKYKVRLKCGHEKIGQKNLLLDTDYCKECRDSAIFNKFAEDGAEVLGYEDKNSIVALKFKCGHISKRKTFSKDKAVCQECEQNRREKILVETGATKTSDGFILACGHKAKVEVYERLVGFKCLACEKEKVISSAEKKGLKFIKQLTYHERLFELPCGHTKALRSTQLKKDIICSFCNETYYSKPSDLYLLIIFHPEGTCLKLGMSNDLFERIDNYKLSEDVAVMVLCQIQIDTAQRCVQIEKALHKKYKDKRIHPEQMKRWMKCGFTECYDISLMNTLLDEITKLRSEDFVSIPKRYLLNE